MTWKKIEKGPFPYTDTLLLTDGHFVYLGQLGHYGEDFQPIFWTDCGLVMENATHYLLIPEPPTENKNA